jgi:hypothetical protein
MNHLHIPVDTIPYTFNAVAVIAFGDVAVASGTFFILVDVVNAFRPPWMLIVLVIPRVTTLRPSLPLVQ